MAIDGAAPATDLSAVAPRGETLGEFTVKAPREDALTREIAARNVARDERAARADAKTAERQATARAINRNSAYGR